MSRTGSAERNGTAPSEAEALGRDLMARMGPVQIRRLLNHSPEILQRVADSEPLDLAERFYPTPTDHQQFTGCTEEDIWHPFPTEALPDRLRLFVEQGASAIGCDESYVALPLLVSVGAAVGNSRELQIKRNWIARSILWGAIVGESGSSKTPALNLVRQPIHERQRKALRQYEEACEEHKAALLVWEKELTAFKRNKDTDALPPEKPKEPVSVRHLVSDATIEAISPILRDNPRGLLLTIDELAGWLDFDRYSSGTSRAAASHWLSTYNAEPLTIDRKTGEPRTISVPMASISVIGGIQPEILNRSLGNENRENGLAARLLMVCPPRSEKRWNEAELDPETGESFARLMDNLLDLQPETLNDGRIKPGRVTLSPAARETFAGFYDAHNQEQVELSGELAAAWAKFEELPARLGLILHLAQCVCRDPEASDWQHVSGPTMQRAIRLTEWFKHESRRVYGRLGRSKADQKQRHLIAWIWSKHDGVVSTRDVQRGCRWLRGKGLADAALDELVEARLGLWEETSDESTNRKSRVLRLHPPASD